MDFIRCQIVSIKQWLIGHDNQINTIYSSTNCYSATYNLVGMFLYEGYNLGYSNRHDAKRDENEPEIVNKLQELGFSVHRLNTPLDLLVGYNGMNYLIEVKMPKKKLTPAQQKFIPGWKGQYLIVYSVEDAIRFAKEVFDNV